MAKARQLTKKQLAVIEDLFGGELDEREVLEKHRVRRSTYERWMGDERFAERFELYVNGLKRRSELLMAKYSCLAAAKLVELTGSEKVETARKACLDIISAPGVSAKKDERVDKVRKEGGQEVGQLPEETASKLLAVLANQEQK